MLSAAPAAVALIGSGRLLSATSAGAEQTRQTDRLCPAVAPTLQLPDILRPLLQIAGRERVGVSAGVIASM